MDEENSSRYASRKFLFCIGGVLMALLLRMNSSLTEAGFLSLCNLFGGGYLAANLGQKAIDNIISKLNPTK